MNPEKLPKRVLEAYIGEYASGKSENAVNRALDLAHLGRKVTLVDSGPGGTLLHVETAEVEVGGRRGYCTGLGYWGIDRPGETGNILKPEVRFCLRHPGDVILDIGYGSFGAQVLNLVEGAEEEQDLNVYAVINIARPMTDRSRYS